MLSGRPFLFTFYLANAINIHPTASAKVDDVLAQHAGGLLSPPSSHERLLELGPFETQTFAVRGRGWDEAAVDLVLPGLGWVSLTGCGDAEVGISLPAPIRAVQREPLVAAAQTRQTMVKFTGSKLRDKRGNTKRRR